MRMTRKGASAIALGLGVAFAAAACAGGAGAADEVPGAPAPAPAADGQVAEVVEVTSLIPESGRVGAMPDFSFGDTFQATQPITLDLLYRVHSGYPVQDDWLIWDAFAENQNITFNRTDVLLSDWEERRGLLISANDFPTLVPVVWPGAEAAWSTGGSLLAVSDYFSYMPHFQHYVEAWGVAGELQTRADEDGNIFLLPGFREAPNIEHTFMINADLFEAAGFGADWNPATFADLTEALIAVQEATDVQWAFSDRWGDGNSPLGAAMNFVGPNFDTQGGWGHSNQRWSPALDQFVANPLTDGYRDMVAWFASLSEAGVLDLEITQDDDTAVEKFINGRSAMITTNFQQMSIIRDDAAEAGIDLNTRMLVVPAGNINAIAGSLMGPGFVLNANIVDSPYFLATLQFLDWLLYSEDGREFAQWGVYGTTWGRDGDGNRIYLDNVGGAGAAFLNPNWDNIAESDRVALNAGFGFQDGVWMNTWGGSNDLVQSVMPAEQRDWVAAMADSKAILPASPGAPLNELEQEEMSILNSAITDFAISQTALFITGQRSMSEWETFRDELRAMNIDRTVEILNNALARARG